MIKSIRKLRPITLLAPAADDDPYGIAKPRADRDGIYRRGHFGGIAVFKIRIRIFRYNGKTQGNLLRFIRILKLPAGKAVIQQFVAADR